MGNKLTYADELRKITPPKINYDGRVELNSNAQGSYVKIKFLFTYVILWNFQQRSIGLE